MTTKKTKSKSGIPIHDGRKDKAERRRMLQEQLRCMIIDGRTHKECRDFVLANGFSKATASNWYRDVKTALDAVGEVRNGEDYDRLRLERVKAWSTRAEKYRSEADEALVRYRDLREGVVGGGGSWKAVVGFEKLAVQHDVLIASALHWDKIPPDRDMSLDEVQQLVMRSLDRHLPKFRRQYIVKLAMTCARLLKEVPKEGRPPNDEAEQIL